MTASPLDKIVGEQLSAVSFVQDYVELHFDGPVVRVFTRPIITTSAGAVTFPASGSRDALCSLIGQKVGAVALSQGHELRITFDRGKVQVPLDAARSNGPEAIHFQDDLTAPVQVWNVE